MDTWHDIQGTWQAAWRAEDGRKTAGDEVRETRLTISGDRYEFRVGGHEFHGTVSGVDRARRRGVIDFVADGPGDGRQARLGIYVLADDELSICVAPAGGQRPASFAARPGSGHSLYLLLRSVPSAPQPVEAAISLK